MYNSHLYPLKRLRNSDTPRVRSTSSTQTLVSKHNSLIQETRAQRMTDARNRVEKIQDEFGVSCSARNQGTIQQMSKGYRVQQ